MSAGHDTAAGDRPEPVGWGGPAREERAEVEMLRDEADRTAEEAARTIAELTERLSPRSLTEHLSPRHIAARLSGNRAIRLAATVLPVAAALAAAAVAAAMAARRRPDLFSARQVKAVVPRGARGLTGRRALPGRRR